MNTVCLIPRVAGLVVVAAATPLLAWAQEPVSPAGPARPVAGTHVWLVPPAGFGPSAGLTGLRKGEAVVQVLDLAGSNFYRHAATFSKARFESRGARVTDFQELTVQGYPARLVQLEQAGAPASVQLLFGDSTFAALLIGRYPAADAPTGAALRTALLSATYVKNQAPASAAPAVFVLDEKKAGFTLRNSGPGRQEYVPAGAPPTAAPLVVSTGPYHPSRTAADISQELLERLQQQGLTSYRARRTSSAKVNDLVTVETEGTGRQQGRAVLLYQQVTVIGSTAVVLQGIVPEENGEAALTQFKALAHTIKPAAPVKK